MSAKSKTRTRILQTGLLCCAIAGLIALAGTLTRFEVVRSIQNDANSGLMWQSEASSSPVHESIQTLEDEWIRRDPEKAYKRARTLQDSQEQRVVLDKIWEAWPRVNPATAAQHIEEVQDPDTRRRLIGSIATQWAAQDPEATLNWVRGLPADSTPPDIMIYIAESWADRNPRDAAEFAIQLPNSDASGENRAVKLVLSRWIMKEPAAVAKWLIGQENRQVAMSGVVQLIWTWSAQHPVEAAQWIESMPAETRPQIELRHYAARNYLDAASAADPRLAARVALRLTSRNARPSALAKALTKWFESDPDAARRWIRTSGLPLSLATPEGRAAYLSFGCCNTPESQAVAALLENVAIAQMTRSSH